MSNDLQHGCMSRKNIRTSGKAGAVGASNITTELNKAFAAARVNALMCGVDLGDTIDPLSTIHSNAHMSLVN